MPGAIEYANSASAARSYGLGVIEVDGIQRQGLVVLEPGARFPLLGMMFLKAFGFRLTVDPSCGFVEVAPTTPRPRRPMPRRQAG